MNDVTWLQRAPESISRGGGRLLRAAVVVYAAVLVLDVVIVAAKNGSWALELAVGGLLGVVVFRRGSDPAVAAPLGLAISAAAATAALIADLTSQPGAVATFALALLCATCVRRCPPAPATLVAGAGGAVLVVGRLGLSSGAMALTITLGLIAWTAAIAAGLWLRSLDQRRRQEIDAVRREERLEMARELHDAVAFHITGVVVQAQAARLVCERRPEALPGALEAIEEASREALAAVRRVVALLRESEPTTASPDEAAPERLSDLAARFAARGLPVKLENTSGRGERRWPAEVAMAVHRLVQEALTNVERHAPDARHVTVTVASDVDNVSVEVRDDAPHSPGVASEGHGLVGMRERVEALGGTFVAGPVSGPGGGWQVSAHLPLSARGHS
jgi:signal transduction histidine kinase